MNDIVFIILAIIICFDVILLIKNKITFKNRDIIRNAIHRYVLEQIQNGEFSSYSVINNFAIFSQMEPYEKTWWRLWDYGYKHIVPEDVYQKIKPYINI